MTKSIIFKIVLCLILASVIALSSIGCDTIKFPTLNNDDATTTDGNDNDEAPSNDSQTEEGKYSTMLQNVLNNEYYNQIIRSARRGNTELYDHWVFKVLPYAFLEDEGHNVDAMKSGELYATTFSFTNKDKPNSLYMCTTVETAAAKPYYTVYLLEYELTDKEMADYKMAHTDLYIQSYFLNNEISALKDPTVLHETRITPHAHTTLYKTLNNSKKTKTFLNNRPLGGAYILGFDVEDGTFEVLVTTTLSTGRTMVSSCYINVMNLEQYTFPVTQNEYGAFVKPCDYASFSWREEQNEPIPVIIYQPRALSLEHTNVLDNN